MSNSELLTIPEAAAQIGVSDRTLYRLLKTGNFAARTVTEHRQTVTGRRLTTLLPPDLVKEIAEAQPPIAPPKVAEDDGARAGIGDADNAGTPNGVNNAANCDENTGETVSNAANGDTDSVPPEDGVEPGNLPAVVYQARIADLTAMNAELRADKERLYRLLEMAQANLAREQTLRALPPPGAVELSPEEAQAETAPGDTPGRGAGVPSILTPAPADQEGTDKQGEARAGEAPGKPAGWGARLKGWFFNA